MTHVSHDDLVLYYYGEAPADQASLVEMHVSSCDDCRAAFERLQEMLRWVDESTTPQPDASFEAVTWARLEPSLYGPEAPWWRSVFTSPGRWLPAGATAALVLLAFVAGWLVRPAAPPTPATVPGGSPDTVRTRVLLVAVGDHLERAHMVLSELVNAPDARTADLSMERTRAAELVTENRLYRQSAAFTGDNTLERTLEDLERVLQEIANAPPDTTDAELDALRARIESRGVLFRVRVLTDDLQTRRDRPSKSQDKEPL